MKKNERRKVSRQRTDPVREKYLVQFEQKHILEGSLGNNLTGHFLVNVQVYTCPYCNKSNALEGPPKKCLNSKRSAETRTNSV
jgi:hypothetical protein